MRSTLLQFLTWSVLTATATFNLPAATVAGLPACTAALNGQIYTVTNALAPALAVAVAGGGAVTVLVHCNGAAWVVG